MEVLWSSYGLLWLSLTVILKYRAGAVETNSSKCTRDMSLVPCCKQVESLDAEIESMAGPKKKAKPQPKLVHLEEATSRHKQHITRLEQVLTECYCEPSMPLISPPFPALCSP